MLDSIGFTEHVICDFAINLCTTVLVQVGLGGVSFQRDLNSYATRVEAYS